MDGSARQVSAAGAAVIASACALLSAGPAFACGEKLGGPARTIESARYTVVYKSVPDPIETGRHFSLEFVVCPHGNAVAPDAVRVDAVMPLHRHGMNYRSIVVASGGGSYRADGLMFHMPGRWDVTFDLATAAGSERMTASIELE